MPIKPENRNRYPKNWKEIREQILKRAGNRCEFCLVENGLWGLRDGQGVFQEKQPADPQFNRRVFRIVLTIAHLDHTPENCDPENLKALCQRCHNRYDVEHRRKTRAITLEAKRTGS